MKILGISGSLRLASTNTRLLTAATHCLPSNVEMHLTAHLAQLPPFSPDIPPEKIPAVETWVQEMKAADGIVVSTPEYASGYPGVLKNAFDWLVSTDAHVDKPFMLLNASGRSTTAQATLTTVLETMSGIHITRASTTVALLGKTTGVTELLATPELANQLTRAMAVFVSELRKRATQQANR